MKKPLTLIRVLKVLSNILYISGFGAEIGFITIVFLPDYDFMIYSDLGSLMW